MRIASLALVLLLPAAPSTRIQGQTKTIALDSTGSLTLTNVKAEPATYKGRSALRVTDAASADVAGERRIVIAGSSDFQDGIIEIDVAGDRVPGAPETARGFCGIAFRVTPEGPYEAFYLRPYNGRSEDQLQRNHSAQYIFMPEFPWERLRKDTPGKYETYVDLAPGQWTAMKIEVRGLKRRLFVNGAQPTLLVDVPKPGPAKGAVALWIGPWTVAYFSNLRITP